MIASQPKRERSTIKRQNRKQPSKQRIDQILVDRGFADCRDKAQRMLMAGEVLVSDKVIDKPSTLITIDEPIRLKNQQTFVSRGGTKLASALLEFMIDVEDRVAIDVGASTGGFTDCLLQNGARQVFAIDVAYGVLAWSVRQEPRVIVLERTNIRHLAKLPLNEEEITPRANLAVIDTSFISLKLVLPATLNLLENDADIIALVKPQFEAKKTEVEQGGVVSDPQIHQRILKEIVVCAQKLKLQLRGLILSPIRGPAGNREFLLWMARHTNTTKILPQNEPDRLDALVREISFQSGTS